MNATLETMTVWKLVSEASLLVKLVMLILVLASLPSWYRIVLRGSAWRSSQRRAGRAIGERVVVPGRAGLDIKSA